MNAANYQIEELGRHHNRDQFSCGVVELDSYLKKDARRHNTSGFNHTSVLVEIGKNDIIGFFSLAAASVSPSSFPNDQQGKLPKYEIPCVRLTRFGIDSNYQGNGFGEYLLFCALRNAVEFSTSIGCFAIIVDAKNEKVKAFYCRYGFHVLSGLVLFLPINEIKASLEK